MGINFTPSQNTYKDLGQFRFWCQKVLPLVYDDSLSYYELLCKVVNFLNETIENVELMGEDMDKLYNAYQELQGYVNTYFDNLDLQHEINNKLNEMATDGALSFLLSSLLDDFKEEINGSIRRQEIAIGMVDARVDMFTSLPEGTTLGESELLDIRVAADGTTHKSAGTAVREQMVARNVTSEKLTDMEDVKLYFDNFLNVVETKATEVIQTQAESVVETKAVEVINSITEEVVVAKAEEVVYDLLDRVETLEVNKEQTSSQIMENEQNISNHKSDSTIHVTAEQKEEWNNKSNFSGSYSDLKDKPTTVEKINKTNSNHLEVAYTDGKLESIDVSVLTTGKVGQIIEIEKVNENGVPIKYRAVNKPTGAGSVVVENVSRDGTVLEVAYTDGRMSRIDMIVQTMVEFYPLTHFYTPQGNSWDFVNFEGICFNLLKPLVEGNSYQVTVNGDTYVLVAKTNEYNGIYLEVSDDNNDFDITYGEYYVEDYGYNTVFHNRKFPLDSEGDYEFEPITLGIWEDGIKKIQKDIDTLYESSVINSVMYPLTHFDTPSSDNHEFDSADGSILINLSEPIEIGYEYLIKLNDVEYKVVATPQEYSGIPTLVVEGEIEVTYNEAYMEDFGFNAYTLYYNTKFDGDDYIFTPYTLGIYKGEQSVKNIVQQLQKDVSELKKQIASLVANL